ncbi:MAG: hypothetical protein ACXW6K_19505 [Candidatus Binatia bacterium]
MFKLARTDLRLPGLSYGRKTQSTRPELVWPKLSYVADELAQEQRPEQRAVDTIRDRLQTEGITKMAPINQVFVSRYFLCIGPPSSRDAQIRRIRKYLGLEDSSRQGARRQVRSFCHFGHGEKSLLEPSHPLGMTGMDPSPLRLCAFARDNPNPVAALLR